MEQGFQYNETGVAVEHIAEAWNKTVTWGDLTECRKVEGNHGVGPELGTLI